MSRPSLSSAPSRTPSARTRAARDVLALCASADALAEQATAVIGLDDDRLFALLEQRDQTLTDLAESLIALRYERPTADSPAFAASAQVVDEADAVVSAVCDALGASQRATVALAVRVADRVAVLRQELAAVQRSGVAGLGYLALEAHPRVDRVR